MPRTALLHRGHFRLSHTPSGSICLALGHCKEVHRKNSDWKCRNCIHFRGGKQHAQEGAKEIAITKRSQLEIRGVYLFCSNASAKVSPLKYNVINARYFLAEDRAESHFFRAKDPLLTVLCVIGISTLKELNSYSVHWRKKNVEKREHFFHFLTRKYQTH